MNKREFATRLADRTELSKADANRALDSILDTLTDAVADRDEVSFLGWGKFSAERRKGRDANDPRNPGRTIHIPPRYVPKFKPGSALKREIRAARPGTLQSEAGRRAPATGLSNGRAQDRSAGRWRPLGQR